MDYSLLVGLHFRDDSTRDKMGLSPFLLRTGNYGSHDKCLATSLWHSEIAYIITLNSSLQERMIPIKMRSSCVAIVSLKQSFKKWIEF